MVLLIAARPSYASVGADNWRSKFPDMKFVGAGVLTVFFMDIYKLNLYANAGLYSERNDFVLEFEYLKPVSKSTIIDASINELTKPNDADDGIEDYDFARGQGYYSVSLAAHPTEKNNVYVGGINLFSSNQGGNDWGQLTHSRGRHAQYLHADQHSVIFTSKVLFLCK